MNKKSTAEKHIESFCDEPRTFGKLLQSIRNCANITQNQLADMMGVFAPYISEIENDKRTVSLERAAEFARALEYSENRFVATVIEDHLRSAGLPFADGPLTFGKLLRSIRICADITQNQLADMVGVSAGNICLIEKGRRAVSVGRAAEFARVLGYSENQFVATAIEDQLRSAGLPFAVELKKADSRASRSTQYADTPLHSPNHPQK